MKKIKPTGGSELPLGKSSPPTYSPSKKTDRRSYAARKLVKATHSQPTRSIGARRVSGFSSDSNAAGLARHGANAKLYAEISTLEVRSENFLSAIRIKPADFLTTQRRSHRSREAKVALLAPWSWE